MQKINSTSAAKIMTMNELLEDRLNLDIAGFDHSLLSQAFGSNPALSQKTKLNLDWNSPI